MDQPLSAIPIAPEALQSYLPFEDFSKLDERYVATLELVAVYVLNRILSSISEQESKTLEGLKFSTYSEINNAINYFTSIALKFPNINHFSQYYDYNLFLKLK